MGQVNGYIGHSNNGKNSQRDDFVLEKAIFSNIFEKDIRRVFIYKKAERIAKAVSLISPAFTANVSLKNRLDTITLGLIDAAMLPPHEGRTLLSRELLALSSILSVAKIGGNLSPMNAEIILHEAQMLLQEVAGYEDPTLSLSDVPSISSIAKSTSAKESAPRHASPRPVLKEGKRSSAESSKGHIKDTVETDGVNKDRKNVILSVIKNKGKASIKDISTVVRGVSEKTVQRELLSLIDSGVVVKTGERRWSTYSLA